MNVPFTTNPNTFNPSMFMLTATQKVLWVQDDFLVATGYSPSQIIGQPFAALGDKQFPKDYWQLMTVLDALKPYRGKVHFRHAIGLVYECFLEIRPFFDEKRALRNYIIYGIPAQGLSLEDTDDIEKMVIHECQENLPQFDLNEAHHVWSKLLHIIHKDKLYRCPDLTLPDLAAQLHLNRTYLSEVLQHFAGYSIKHLLNQFRVTEARTSLLLPENQGLTLDAIGKASGFGSERSFYRVFKQFEGVTPRQFKLKNR